ncbi:lysophospholipid acyltransferase family protein [Thalassobacter stenotrophicus]|uniref:lysophospholipid acyltransferase family protein n=1 Tax=Thalassobacter stenotrophicus TaxID=266809 RepID=UPI000AED509E|nr:lysophospholipid acyltransferase family protein [Thalassobacter stenotrophicus]
MKISQRQGLKMSKMKMAGSLRHRLQYGAIRAVISTLSFFPFRQRSAFMAWVMSRVIAPVVGYRKRIRNNLDLILPDLGAAQRNTLTTEVTRNIGRTICELFSPQDLLSMARQTELTGPGLVALEEARAANRPAIVVSGHFGNYDIVRAGLIAHGFNVGGLYRHMNNPFFHKFYLNNISAIGTPLFERGRPGLGQMVRHLKSGGILAALIDVRANTGVPLPFVGQDALTATSMAELALRYDALLVPSYATRLASGEGFVADCESPIPHTDPETMTRALNHSLEIRVLKNPEQWFWIHNRWKGADS